jgi:VWFA-related protein
MSLAASKAWGTGLIGLALAAGAPLGAAVRAQAATPQQGQQNSVPDAPRPQTLPQLNTITPLAPAAPAAQGGAVPNAPTPQADAASPDNGGGEPGTTLPSTSTANSSPTTTADPQTPGDSQAGAPPAAHFDLGVVQVNFVQVPFTVKDSKGQLVPGLTYRDVQVYENGLRQRIRLFTVDPLPLSVAMVIDQSVTFDTMQKINASLTALQGAFTPYDEVAIFTYNNGVKEQTGFTGAQSARLTFALENSKGAGRDPMMPMGGPLAQTTVKNNQAVDPNTNGNNNTTLTQATLPPREYHTLNDAILTAAETVARSGPGRRRVVYLISDGREYGSQAKEKEVIKYLQRNQIAVYATLVGDTAIPGVGWLDRFHLPLTMRDDVLPRYVDATGGEADPEFRPQSIQNNFAKLTEQVRTQYTLGYYSHEPFIDGKYRSVDVRVERPNLTVIAEKGYYPRASPSSGGAPRPVTAGPSTGPSTAPGSGGASTAPAGTPPTP